jgi:uncharacterized membrane protein YjjP (DUF1212 family)
MSTFERNDLGHGEDEAQHALTERSVDDTIKAHNYLITLCTAMMFYGAPTHRMEDYLSNSARKLGLDNAHFIYLHGLMVITFGDGEFPTAKVNIVRVKQGLNLGRMHDVHSIYKDVIRGNISVDEAQRQLKYCLDNPDKLSVWWRVLGYGLASAFVAPFAFGGRLIDMPVAFMIGSLVGFLQLVVAPRSSAYANVFEVTSTTLTAFFARLCGSLKGGNLFCFGSLAQSGIVLILPGYMILCAIMELSTGNVVTGGVRMVQSLLHISLLTFGITLGSALVGLMDAHPSDTIVCSNGVPAPLQFLFVAAFTLTICAIFQARLCQVPGMVALAMIGYTVNSLVSKDMVSASPAIVVAVAAFAVSFMANAPIRCIWSACTKARVWQWCRRQAPSHLRRHLKKRRRYSYQLVPSFLPSVNDAMKSVEADEASNDAYDEYKCGPQSQSPMRDTSDTYTGNIGTSYGYAAATMIPAIFVLVPSGIAAMGSLLAGTISANKATQGPMGATTNEAGETPDKMVLSLYAAAGANGIIGVILTFMEVALGVSFGLFLGLMLWWPRWHKKDNRGGVSSF